MKQIPFNVDEDLFDQTNEIVSSLGVSRNTYLREALLNYNRMNKEKRMKEVAISLKGIDVELNSEFENVYVILA
ncbi:MAG: hypothetical protein JEZ14_24240 [Marinilabiliaceae bacterium]|nr:hypothetical protein [Marinilabiliaceae bacterium]